MTKTRFSKRAIICLLSTVLVLVVWGAALACPTIDVTASNWKFTPAKITITTGELTKLRLTSAGGVHGLKSDDLGIKDTTISPGKFVIVELTPKKAGTYVVHCSVVCGPGHPDMALTIIVADK